MSALTREDWRRINDIFHDALSRPPEEREPYVRSACGDRLDLHTQVTSLLAAHERVDTWLDSRARIGTIVGHYRILGLLGEGGMGIVYLAEDLRLGRRVALKAVAARLLADESRSERLRQEARAAAALGHPGIATVYALEEIEGETFIASEYVPGETLRDEITRGAVPLAQAIETGLMIARALVAAHDHGIIHRDIKPENLMRTPGGQVKVLDFGLARMLQAPGGPQLTRDGTRMGTPAYMAPEQLRGERLDARADLFALGVVLYELATGVHPFAAPDLPSTVARILDDAPAPHAGPAAERADERWREFDAVVQYCLAKSVSERIPSAAALVQRLERLRPRVSDPVRSSTNTEEAGATGPHWWWQFHQAAVAVAYPLLLVPIWAARGRIGGAPGRALFVGALAAVIVAVMVRLHLWFALRSYPTGWPAHHARVARWVRVADAVFVAALAAAGLAVLDVDATLAAILIGAAVGVLVSSAIIEPATTRAAFPDATAR